MRQLGARVGATLILLLTAAHCASVGNIGFTEPDGGGPGAPLFEVDAEAGPAECPSHCSSDLHYLLDCNDQVLHRCSDDKGCALGNCVPVCEAAEKGESNAGCEYFTFYPPHQAAAFGDDLCFATFVANTWDTPVQLSASWQGNALDVGSFAYVPSGNGRAITYAPLSSGSLEPGKVAILFLAGRCAPGTSSAVTMPSSHESALRDAFQIRASAPVVAHSIFPYGGGDTAISSASLLLPTGVWGKNYVGIAPGAAANNFGSPWLSIVAKDDETHVTLQSDVAIVGGTDVEPASAGSARTYALSRGQVLQLVQPEELTGTTIESDKAVGVWGGHGILCVPQNQMACDAAHQQIPPVKALGHEYVGVRHPDRYENTQELPFWRIVGVVDGTKLTYDSEPPVGAPTELAKGQKVDFRRRKPFIVKSQDSAHPFYVAQYMTGCAEYYGDDDSDCRGDPEFVNVVPPQQYLSTYTFLTDPTYPETHLVVTRKKGPDGFADVNLDCAGALTGWQAIGDYEWTHVALVRGNFEPQGNCDNGRHEATSKNPFSLTVWGWGSKITGGTFQDPRTPGFYTQAVSYAYPAGASVHPVSNIVVPVVPK